MKVIPIVFLFCLCSYFASGQSIYTVRGNLMDTASRAKPVNSTITVLRAKDSVLCGFTWNEASPYFSITYLAAGDYILLVTADGYADYTGRCLLDTAHPIYDFGNIPMLLKSKLLAEIVVQGKVTAITIKGDTTEYNAAAYKMDLNAKVEDLLKQFPGISVDQNGNITAQGKKVTKVLVDGEEFFGDDPTLVTQNIRADMVDKVLLYERNSDRAAFTGVDDGKKERTLNIKLREDKKIGYFGKVNVGGGTDKKYRAQGMFNAFSGKRHISLFGNLDNTGKLGMNWWDNNKYGMSSDNVQFLDGGSVTFIASSNDELETFSGQYNGQGYPEARLGGLHYDNKFNDDKEAINVSYKIGSLSVNGTSSTLTQNNLPESYINSSSGDLFHKDIYRQRLLGSLLLQLDSTSSLKLSMDGMLKNSSNTDSFTTVSHRADNTLLNSNQRTTDNHGDEQDFNVKLLYAKKFKKPKRTLTLSVAEIYSHNKANGTLKSVTSIYDSQGLLSSKATIDQFKHYTSENSILNAGITYTEPISPEGSLSLQYGLTTGTGTTDRQTFNPTAPGKYNLLDSTFSNSYKLDQLSHLAGAEFTFKIKKSLFRFGTDLALVSFNQVNQYDNSSFKRNFTNWNPKAVYTYSFASGYLAVGYNRTTKLPTLNQLQPVAVNTDPLNIAVGNPELKPAYLDLLNVTFSTFKPLTNQAIWYVITYGTTSRPIVDNRTTDSTGKSIYQSANINHNSNYFALSGGVDRTIGAWKLKLGENTVINGNTTYSLVNGVLNKTNSYDLSEQITFSKTIANKYSFNGAVGPSYSIQQSSLQRISNNSAGFTANGGFTLYLPGRFQIASDANYKYYGRTQQFAAFSRLLLNTSLSRIFLKDESLKVTVLGNDLLNQNLGFNRSASGNLIMENSYTTIRRYFMLSVSWDFSKMKGGK